MNPIEFQSSIFGTLLMSKIVSTTGNISFHVFDQAGKLMTTTFSQDSEGEITMWWTNSEGIIRSFPVQYSEQFGPFSESWIKNFYAM